MKWLVSGTDNDDDVLDTFMYAYVLCIVIQLCLVYCNTTVYAFS